MAYRPSAVAFDVIETLMPLEPLRARLQEVGEPGRLLDLWFARTLRDGFALTAAGDFRPFPEVAEQALRTAAGRHLDRDAVRHVLGGFDELPAHPDVTPAMRALADGGVRISCLTNGSHGVTQRFLDRTGLGEYVERVIAAEEIGTWKPPARSYYYAADALGLAPDRLALVAAHAWDCHGAKRAGLVTGWISRLEGRYADIFHTPDVAGDDLVAVCERLLDLENPSTSPLFRRAGSRAAAGPARARAGPARVCGYGGFAVRRWSRSACSSRCRGWSCAQAGSG